MRTKNPYTHGATKYEFKRPGGGQTNVEPAHRDRLAEFRWYCDHCGNASFCDVLPAGWEDRAGQHFCGVCKWL